MKKQICIYFLIFLFGRISNGFNIINFFKKHTYNKFLIENRFRPVQEEKTIKIKHNNQLFTNLNNKIYAQIGSNPKFISNFQSYTWLDGDGMIHAVCFNKSSLTYHNKWIETRKINFENKMNRKIFMNIGNFYDYNGIFNFIIFSIKTFLKMIPPVKGTANTALFKSKNRIFALYEGDMPYELEFTENPFNVITKSYMELENITSLTAHPLIDKKRNLNYIYTYNNYDWKDGKLIFNVFNEDMKFISQKNISLINNGIIHSITNTEDKIIVADMPMKFSLFNLLNFEQPLYFDKEGITRFGIFDIDKMNDPEWYYFDENFFIFHFAKSFETETEYIIYACLNKDLNMKTIMKFEEKKKKQKREDSILREIRINKKTKKTSIKYNRYLEYIENIEFPYFLDFPQPSIVDENILYACIFDAEKAYIRGVLKINIKDFRNTKPDIFLFPENTFGTAEFQPVKINNKEYLMGFIDKENQHSISLINIKKKKIESIDIPARIPPGFHSICFEK